MIALASSKSLCMQCKTKDIEIISKAWPASITTAEPEHIHVEHIVQVGNEVGGVKAHHYKNPRAQPDWDDRVDKHIFLPAQGRKLPGSRRTTSASMTHFAESLAKRN